MLREPIKVVFDCNVLWQAFFSENGAAGRCKKLVESGDATLFLSAEVLAEARDVLTRPEVRQKFTRATPEAVDAFLQDLSDKAILVKRVPKKFSYARDPKDEPYINLAVAVKAEYLVSHDKDLLDLMTGITDECKEFRRRFRPLKVIAPEALLREFAPVPTSIGRP